jgi:uncharacterized protein YfaQ (DUF2300 family)
MHDQDDSFGPGTDLVISLFAVTLIFICGLNQLYQGSISSLINLEANTEEQIAGITQERDELLDNIEQLNHQAYLQSHTLQRENEHLLAQVDKLNIYKILLEEARAEAEQAESLKKGHEIRIPKRSPKGKAIHRVYVSGSPDQLHWHYKPAAGERIRVTRKQAHQYLKKAEQRQGSNLYVAVVPPDNFSVGLVKKIRCEFWVYDYYRYFNEGYCS